jgi:hypothetical protein
VWVYLKGKGAMAVLDRCLLWRLFVCFLSVSGNVVNGADHEHEDGDVTDCMEFSLGQPSENPIIVYVVPSCFHCGLFLAEKLSPFLIEHGQRHNAKVRFIVTTPKDIFIMKLFFNMFENDKCTMFWKVIDLLKRAVATIKAVKPTRKQWKLCKDSELVKLCAVAQEFGFSFDEVKAALPVEGGATELALLTRGAKYAAEIFEVSGKAEIETPCILQNGRLIQSLEDAVH